MNSFLRTACLLAAGVFVFQVASATAGEVIKTAPYTLPSNTKLTVDAPTGTTLNMQTDGNLVLYKGLAGAQVPIWGTMSYQNCAATNSCSMQFLGLGGVYQGANNGNLVLFKGTTPYWNSGTGESVWGNKYGANFKDYRLALASEFPYISITNGRQMLWTPLLGQYFVPEKLEPLGYDFILNPITPTDGIFSGWVVYRETPNTPTDLRIKFSVASCEEGGPCSPTDNDKLPSRTTTPWEYVIRADQPNYSPLYQYGVTSKKAFYFRIPDAFRVGFTFKVSIEAYPSLFGFAPGQDLSFNLPPVLQVGKISYAYGTTQDIAVGRDCLKPNSRCATTSNDYNTAAFPEATGWSDGKNYFNEWGCTSTAGINYIARLNVLPFNPQTNTFAHGLRFQKDSFYMNSSEQMDGGPVIYFSSTRNDTATKFALKKTAYNPSLGKWVVYDVLDTKSAGGVSSQDGVYPNYIMNDYALPGWGPVSPLRGSVTKIPGVSNISANPEGTSFPLEGLGPRGLTNIVNHLQLAANDPDIASDGPEGRTCIHMNPKLFDYDANGVPRRMMAYLFRGSKDQHDVSKTCILPDGVVLQEAGYYAYKYDATKGWQLEGTPPVPLETVSVNPVTDSAIKLAWNTPSTFIAGNWKGQITSKLVLAGGTPAQTAKKVMLDCSASDPNQADGVYTGVRFGEASGSLTQVVFAGLPAGDLYPQMNDPAKVVANQANLSGTSQSSQNIIASGTATFTMAKNNVPLAGMALVTDAADETRYMYGHIKSYNKTTGVMMLDVSRNNGSGAVANWKIYVTDVYVADLYYAFHNGN